MEVIYVLLPLSIFLGAIFVIAYCWSARTGQFEDLDTPAVRILPEEGPIPHLSPLVRDAGYKSMKGLSNSERSEANRDLNG